MEIQTVGVIGAGQMGSGIAQVAAMKGFDVRLLDNSSDRLAAGVAAIQKGVQRWATKSGADHASVAAVIGRIRPTSAIADLGDADLTIEAATENLDVKTAILQSLAGHLSGEAIVATNTSSISITRLAAATDRPDRFIGLHFMNPVPVMRLVEVIRGIGTSSATYDAVVEFAGRLEKVVTVAEDYPAFIVNRILIPMINEAIYAIYEGVGTVHAVETGLRLGANHPMGPLELADLIGLDTVASIMGVLYEGMGDPKYRTCPLLVKYVEAGWLGRKAGRGFYDYSGGTPVPTR